MVITLSPLFNIPFSCPRGHKPQGPVYVTYSCEIQIPLVNFFSVPKVVSESRHFVNM